MTSKNNRTEKVCSFCGRSERDVKLLITGLTGYICEDCAAQAYEIVKSTGVLDDARKKQGSKFKPTKVPKPREIKEYLDKLCSGGKAVATGFKKPYKAAKFAEKAVDAQYILSGEHDAEIIKVIKAVVSAEEPISAQFLLKRVLSAFGLTKHGVKLDAKINSLIQGCGYQSADIAGVRSIFRSDKFSSFDRYRVEDGVQLRTSESDYSPYDIISLVKSILLNKVSMYSDELVVAVQRELKVPRLSDRFASYINLCIDYGASKGIFVRSISDKISLT